MNLNAEWGAGKTYFLKRWQETIKDTYPTAYIDAWKHDFDNDPLLLVMGSIIGELKMLLNEQENEHLRGGIEELPNILDGLITKADKVWKAVTFQKVKNEANAVVENFTGVNIERFLSNEIKYHSQKLDDIKIFKDSLEKYLKDIVDLEGPFFIFIDELDRCRPTYAIEMLEVIKHLFDIKGLVFVVATNTDQLQHSIKAVYGEGFDADTYLRRFFRRSYALNKPDLESYISTHQIFVNKLSESLLTNEAEIFKIQQEELVKILAGIARNFKFDVRTTDQWLEQIHACYPIEPGHIHKTFWLMTAFLLAIYLKPFFERNLQEIKEYPSLQSVNDRKKVLERFSDMDSKSEIVLEVSPQHFHGRYFTISGPTRIYEFSQESKFEINLKYVDFNKICYDFIANTNQMNIDSLINGAVHKQEYSAIPMIMNYYNEQYGTTFDTYLDLVKMATNLK